MSDDAVILNGYRLVNLIQTGQHSQIWEAEDVYSGRRYALKVLLPEAARDPLHRRLLANEAKVGMQLSHPYIVKTYKYFPDKEAPHLIMELFPSVNLAVRIIRKHPVVHQQARKIIEQAASALDYLHEKGFVHKDVKPTNLLVAGSGDVRLIDFALAERMGGFLAGLFRRSRKVQGTRSYMAPEQIRGQRVDQRADIYSFGCTIYEMLTGRPPFRADSPAALLYKQIHEKPRPVRTFNPNVTELMDNLVMQLLEKDPAKRPQSMREFLQMFQKVALWVKEPTAAE